MNVSRFQREDPTFRVAFDDEAKETVLSGDGRAASRDLQPGCVLSQVQLYFIFLSLCIFTFFFYRD